MCLALLFYESKDITRRTAATTVTSERTPKATVAVIVLPCIDLNLLFQICEEINIRISTVNMQNIDRKSKYVRTFVLILQPLHDNFQTLLLIDISLE